MDKMGIKKHLLKQLLEEMKEEDTPAVEVVEVDLEEEAESSIFDEAEEDYNDEYDDEDYEDEECEHESKGMTIDIFDVFAKLKDNDKEVVVDPKPIIKSKKFRKKR